MFVSELFDAKRSQGELKPLVELLTPALEGTHKYGVSVFVRSWNEAERDERPVSALLVYHQLLDALDGTRALIAAGCGVGAIPVVRFIFECILAIDYMLHEDENRRSAAYLVTDLHRCIERLQLLDPETPAGERLVERMRDDKRGRGLVGDPFFRDRTREVALVEAALSHAALEEAETEWQRVRRKRKGRFPWYRLFGGPNNLRELADTVGRPFEYEAVYGLLSRSAHAEDPHRLRNCSAPGLPVPRLRTSYWEFALAARLALLYGSTAHKRILEYYRPGELMHERWWASEIAPVIDRLNVLCDSMI